MIDIKSIFTGLTVDESQAYTVDDCVMTIDGTGITETTVTDTESIHAAENKISDIKRSIKENKLTAFDTITKAWKAMLKLSDETFSSEIWYYDSHTYLSDSIQFNKLNNKINTIKLLEEKSVEISSSNKKIFGKWIFETQNIGAIMRLKNFFDRLIKETLEPLESALKSIYERFQVFANIRDAENSKLSKNMKDVSINNDSIRRRWRARKDLYEKLPVSEEERKVLTKAIQDNVTGEDVRIAQALTGILSDINISYEGMDKKEFTDAINKPSGYTKFSEFKVGQYDYQSAIYRMVIRKKSLVANPLIYDYKVHVDIDDVKDRGTVFIPAEETKVYFNRTYYTAPDVVVNVVGGREVIIPTITETDGQDDGGRYFKVILKNMAGQPVEGTISWNSNGY